ncbi:MAG: OmpA family protein [Chitinophagales bacterium]|nr:OmpA family protein [Chitinophagales bacterium]
MKNILSTVIAVFSFCVAGVAHENGIMSTYADSSYSDMNGVIDTYYDETQNDYKNFNGIRTEIEPQSEKDAKGMNGIMDVFDANSLTTSKSEKLPIQQSIAVPVLRFSTYYPINSYRISTEDKAALQKLFQPITNEKIKLITVTGYTDPTGTKAYNRALSERRAKQVVDYLKQNNIQAKKLQYEGAGIDDTNEDFQQSRRVDILIYFE